MILHWINILEILNVYSSEITVYFSKNGGDIPGVPLSIFQNDFSGGWDTLFSRLQREIPDVVEPQSPTEDWEEYTLYDRNGTMLESTQDLVRYDQQFIYIVPRNRYFIWPHVRPGHRAYLKNIVDGKIIILESISKKPRLFLIYNLFSEEEADDLVNNALSLEGHNALHRSTTGDGNFGADRERTSDNAWDLKSPAALAVSERMFGVLRMQHDEKKVDGLQIVRYKEKQAYRQHHDYFVRDASGTNYDPSTGGTNRYATIFLYLSHVEEGGQTMFPHAQVLPDDILNELEQDTIDLCNSHKKAEEVIPKIETFFEPNSWEQQMSRQCYQVLSVKPKKAAAVLFYNVKTNWKTDSMTLHGGCPVLNGTKWGANAWIWNDKRPDEELDDIEVVFTNRFRKEGTLLWLTHPIGRLVPGESSSHGTYDTHVFRFEIDGQTVWRHKMNKNDGPEQIIDIIGSSYKREL